MLQRLPRRELAPFVDRLWACEAGDPVPGGRELVLPTGAMHVVIRLDEPLRLFARPDDDHPTAIGHAIIGGARACAYVRDVSRPGRSVGAQLRPGAAGLLGVPAAALAERHTVLDDVWGAAAQDLRERLAELDGPGMPRAVSDPGGGRGSIDGPGMLDVFEAALLARVPRVRGVHPAIAHALAQLDARADVGAVVDALGYSHRRFIALFHDAVGLTPKRYARVQRLQRALAGIATHALAAVAADAGYSDQAHLTREFRALAGVSPGAYRARGAGPRNHVPWTPRDR